MTDFALLKSAPDTYTTLESSACNPYNSKNLKQNAKKKRAFPLIFKGSLWVSDTNSFFFNLQKNVDCFAES